MYVISLVFYVYIHIICIKWSDYMEYLSLFKANYINDIDVKKLYDDRLNSMNTVHFSIKIHDNPSFLCINKELTVLLEEIQFLNSKIIQKNLIPKHI